MTGVYQEREKIWFFDVFGYDMKIVRFRVVSDRKVDAIRDIMEKKPDAIWITLVDAL